MTTIKKKSNRPLKKPNLKVCDNCPNNNCDKCATYMRLMDSLGCD